MNYKLRHIHLFVILLLVLILSCIKFSSFNLGFFKFRELATVQDATAQHAAALAAQHAAAASSSASPPAPPAADADADTTAPPATDTAASDTTAPAAASDGVATDTYNHYYQQDAANAPLVIFNTNVNGESIGSYTPVEETDYASATDETACNALEGGKWSEGSCIEESGFTNLGPRQLYGNGSPMLPTLSGPAGGSNVVNSKKVKQGFMTGGLKNFFNNLFGIKEGLASKPPSADADGGDEWILKSKIVPPVCPKCPEQTKCDCGATCPPCPAPARCPEPAFECKKVPNYRSTNDNYLPRPVLADFSQFGM